MNDAKEMYSEHVMPRCFVRWFQLLAQPRLEGFLNAKLPGV
jgi:hypothetical protein